MTNIDMIKSINRPLEIPDEGFITDLLWADPMAGINGYVGSERGTSYTFGQDVAADFLNKYDFDLICRAHQVVNDGFDFPYYPDQSVVTIFSAPNYCDEFGNNGAMLTISSELSCSFQFIKHVDSEAPDEIRPNTPM